MQSGSMPPMRKGHLEWLRRARGRGHGQRASGPALHLPLNRPRTEPRTEPRTRASAAIRALVVGLSSTLLLAGFATPALASPREPRLMAASDVVGTPYATALVSLSANNYGICTAAVWKPTVLMTAAHCVIDANTQNYIDPSTFAVVNPGGPFRVTTAGVEGAAPARVVRSFVVDGFRLNGSEVPANDIAFVTLDRPIGTTTFTRLATTVELARWLTDGVPVSAIGYGFPSPDRRVTDVPREAALPLTRVVDDFRGSSGLAILSTKSAGIDACSGDSGGPRFVDEFGARILLGNIAGGSCNGLPGPGVIGFTGMSYRALANQALLTAGLPTIPSRPTEVEASRVQTSTTAWWLPPTESPETVVGYDVVDARGALLCTTTTTTCSFPTGNTGVVGMAVRARNAQGEGDASLSPEATMLRADAPQARVLKAGTPRKPVRFTVTPVDYPNVIEYRVTNPRGKAVCAIEPTATPLQCRVRLEPGKYRFRVVAVTSEGTSVPSALSRVVRVR